MFDIMTSKLYQLIKAHAPIMVVIVSCTARRPYTFLINPEIEKMPKIFKTVGLD